MYVAPTWDNSDMWVPTMRHIAKEGRIHVIGVTFCLRGSDVPADLPGRDDLYARDDDWLAKGNSCIVGPDGELLAGPLEGSEGIVYAELDVEAAGRVPPRVRSRRPLRPSRRLPPARRHPGEARGGTSRRLRRIAHTMTDEMTRTRPRRRGR